MCTCIGMRQNGVFYFGRNLDLEYSFGEQVAAMPRAFPLSFCFEEGQGEHFAMIGMASVEDGYPLYAEAVNEKGVCMAGLNFPGNAHYFPSPAKDSLNLAPWELIPYLLGRCERAAEAALLLRRVRLVDRPFKGGLPLAPLHWMVADAHGCFVAEPMPSGMRVYENAAGVLTNNPPFEYHMQRLNDYMNLTPAPPVNRMTPALPLRAYGQGMGSIGLPGDASPSSRFVRAAYYAGNSACAAGEAGAVSQFFHILGAVEMVRGGVLAPDGRYDITTYACCANAEEGIYYYRTYENSRINAVRLDAAAAGSELALFPLEDKQDILYRN